MKLKVMYWAVALLVVLALCVSIPLVMPAVLAAKQAPLTPGTERSLLLFTGVCLAMILTLGGATVGAAAHLAPMPRRMRLLLYGAWIYALTSMVFLSGGYMLARYTGESLIVVLSVEWIVGNLPLVVYMANISLSSEVVLVCALVAGSAIGQRMSDEKATVAQAAKVGGADLLEKLKIQEMTARELQAATGMSQWQVKNRLEKLAKRDLIVHDDGHPRRYSAKEAA